MQKRLIAVLSASLIVALLVIAYLAGRMSVQRPPAPQAATVIRNDKPVQQAAATPPVDATRDGSPVDRQIPTPAKSEVPSAPPIPVPPATAVPSAQPETPRPSTAPATDPAVAAYFARVDAVQVEGSGDPTAFAQGILAGIQSEDFSQIDKLVADAKAALNQAGGIRPPSVCAEYHRRLLEALKESVAGLQSFRTAIEKHDPDAVLSVANQLQDAQQKINDLQSMRRQLLSQ
jgi:hypothetical protein